MYKLINFSVLFLFFITQLGCVKTGQINELDYKSSIYFNELKYEDTLHTNIIIKNVSNKDIKILGIYESCGCISSILIDSIIPKHSVKLIKIKYVPKDSGDSGKTKKLISIRTDNKNNEFLSLFLIGRILKNNSRRY